MSPCECCKRRVTGFYHSCYPTYCTDKHYRCIHKFCPTCRAIMGPTPKCPKVLTEAEAALVALAVMT